MQYLYRGVLAGLLTVLVQQAFAANVINSVTTIKSIEFYYHQSGSNVVIITDQTRAGCAAGFWLSRDDPSYIEFMGVINSAYANKLDVQVDGDAADDWLNESERYCRLTGIRSFRPI